MHWFGDRLWKKSMFFTECAMAVLMCPLLIIAIQLSVEHRLYGDRIEQIGLFGRIKTIPFPDIKQMKCHTGRGSYRSIILLSNTKTQLTSSRSGYWETAQFLKQQVPKYDWQLKYTVMTGEKSFWEKY